MDNIASVQQRVTRVFHYFGPNNGHRAILSHTLATNRFATNQRIRRRFARQAAQFTLIHFRLVRAMRHLFYHLSDLARFPMIIATFGIRFDRGTSHFR